MPAAGAASGSGGGGGGGVVVERRRAGARGVAGMPPAGAARQRGQPIWCGQWSDGGNRPNGIQRGMAGVNAKQGTTKESGLCQQ